jgi:hypothetical protein
MFTDTTLCGKEICIRRLLASYLFHPQITQFNHYLSVINGTGINVGFPNIRTEHSRELK